MNPLLEERFAVFLRESDRRTARPETIEQEVVCCASYAEARQLQRQYQGAARQCVIRYLGPAGGGD